MVIFNIYIYIMYSSYTLLFNNINPTNNNYLLLFFILN